jgi:hypothetical protein
VVQRYDSTRTCNSFGTNKNAKKAPMLTFASERKNSAGKTEPFTAFISGPLAASSNGASGAGTVPGIAAVATLFL